MTQQKILIVAAHPDDETLGCGATIARLAAEGHYIHLVTFTDGVGARAQEASNRNSKLEEVSEKLGISSYAYGQFPDNQLDSVPLLELCKFLEQEVAFAPDIIFTHHPNCLNIDHELVYRATVTVFRPQSGTNQKIYSYYIPSSTDYNPRASFGGNVYYDVKEYKEKKLECLRDCYDEEMRASPHTRSYENIENLLRTWGAEVGLEYAEKFELVREVR